MTRLSLISREGCHLCEVAEQTLDRIAAGQWTRVEVGDSIELERDYGDRVPVVLLDGAEHSYWEVDEPRLRADLANR